MSTITSYKCPNCDSDIPFDAEAGTLKCPRCNSEYSIDYLERYDIEHNIKADSFTWQETNNNTINAEGRITYTCPNCQGAVTGDANMASTSCPYCGSSIIVQEQLSGMLEPELVIPFKLTKDEAKATYEKYLKKKLFLPNNFKTKNFIEKLNGIYVPYWLFDCKAYGQARYKASRTHSYISGDYKIIETENYLVYREGSAIFNYVPVDASTKLADGLMDALEPYDFSKAVDFNTAYLSGFLTDKYDQNEKESAVKANSRIKNSMYQMLSSSVMGYDTVVPLSDSCQFSNGVARYALLPVYIFSTKYNNKVYQFAMNGQTGEFAGNLPADKSKVIIYTLLIFVISFVLVYFITYFTLKGGI